MFKVPCEKKSQVEQHVKTARHQAKCKEIKYTKVAQTSLQQSLLASSSKSSEQEHFNMQLCDALVSANIPLNKLQNTKFKNFLETFCNKTIPHESTLRKNYLTPLYNNVISEIKKHVKNNFLYIIVDETTDVSGRYIVNLLVGVLSEKIVQTSFLIGTKELEKTNSLEIVRFVNQELMTFFAPEVIPTENILLLVSDAAAYMIKAGTNLKIFYKNLTHVTCLAHGINRVAEEVRLQFPLINSLVNNVKKIFVKAPLRVQLYKERLPKVPLPPQPVLTRWGTWLEAAIFYADNYNNIKNIILDFENTADCITKCKNLFEKQEIKEQLAFIKAHYSLLSLCIKELETKHMSLVDAIDIVNRCESELKCVPGAVGKIVLNKFNSVISKNHGYQVLVAVSKILTGEHSNRETNFVNTLNPQQIASLKFAPITSVDVERSFSAYKEILSDRRQKFTVENLEKHLIIKWYSTVTNNK